MATTVRIPIDVRTAQFQSNAGNAFYGPPFEGADPDWGGVSVWQFAPSVDGKVYGIVGIPPNVAATPNAAIVLIMAQAGSSPYRMNVGAQSIPTEDTEFQSLDAEFTNETAQDHTPSSATTRTRDVLRFPSTGSLANSISAEDSLVVQIFREGSHANDTSTVITELWETYLEIDVE